MTRSPVILRAENVTTELIGPISLVLHAGECVCLTGESGSGKSLLLRALADLDPHAGEIALSGTPQQQVPAPTWRRQVAYLAAESRWWLDRVGRHFISEEQPAYGALGFRDEVADWQVSRLSSGEKQRLALLRAMQFRPDILLLDEITANVDPQNSRRVEAMIRQYLADNHAAAIWVSHDPAQVERVAERVFTLAQGKLQAVA